MSQIKSTQLMQQVQFEYKSIESQINPDKVQYNKIQQNNNQFNRFDIQHIYNQKNIKQINIIRSNFIFLLPIFKRGGRYAIAIQFKKIPFNIIKIFIIAIICYFINGWISKMKNIQKFIQTGLSWVFAIILFLFIMIPILDPGFVLDHQIFQSQYIQTSDKTRPKGGKYCDKCRIFVKVKTNHCYNCHHCVVRFDHHCGVIGRCVGGFNLIVFYGFTILANLVYLGMIGLFIYEYFIGQK